VRRHIHRDFPPDMIPYGRQSVDQDDIDAVIEVLKSDWITTGPKIPEFEEALKKYTGTGNAVVVNSGTSALDISVQALDLPKGSEVITTPFTFAATVNALLYNDIMPVFADIEPETRNIDPDEIRRKITDRTRAIICVDFAGHPCDYSILRDIAGEYGLFLIEDACHALGAEYRNKKIGSLADMTIFSFHPVKHITTGEGGAVTLEKPEWYSKLQLLRNHGIDRDARSRYGPESSWAYDMKYLGRNYRMTDFQAALGISQLRKIDSFVRRRNEIAERYRQLLSSIPGISLPEVQPHVRHAWHLYTILLDYPANRQKFFMFMKEGGIGVNVHYIPVYHHSYYQEQFRFRPEDFPVTEDIFRRIVTLPLYPAMTDDDVDTVVRRIQKFFRKRG